MKRDYIAALFSIVVLTLIWFYLNQDQASFTFYLLEIPYFVILNGMLLFIGIPTISLGLRYGTKTSFLKSMVFPFILIFLYYTYAVLHDQPFMEGASMLLPYLVFFPAISLYHRSSSYKNISWLELLVLILFLLPITLVDIPENTTLPLNGIHFDSVYRMVMILTAVYSFVVMRRLKGVGFRIDPSWKKLWTTFWVWLVYISFVILVGTRMHFIVFEGIDMGEWPPWDQMVERFLTIFLHTALFEELFFRGLFQNMLSRKISQASNTLIFWLSALLIICGLSFATGWLMDNSLFWLPLAVTAILFFLAYAISNLFAGTQHHYLALAITSVLFGLVHYHSGSVEYVSLAILAGWAYGYVYLKTRNVFYSALIHTLVNFSPLILGIELIK